MSNGINDSFETLDDPVQRCVIRHLGEIGKVNRAITAYIVKDPDGKPVKEISGFVEQEILQDVLAMFKDPKQTAEQIAAAVQGHLAEKNVPFDAALFADSIRVHLVRAQYQGFREFLSSFALDRDVLERACVLPIPAPKQAAGQGL